MAVTKMSKTSASPTSQVEMITPEVAERYLLSNTHNRHINAKAVTAMAEDMTSGRWVFNGDAIRFTSDGQLIDGQHRLSAIIEANVHVEMFVVRGLDKNAFTTIDAGRSRTAAQIMSLAGGHYVMPVTAAARLALLFSGGRFLNDRVSRKAITDFVAEQPYLAELAERTHSSTKVITQSPLMAVLFLANYRRQFTADVDTFIEGIASGANLERGDPRLTLRDWAQRERARGRGNLSSYFVFAAAARAWNAHVRGETLLQIKIINAQPHVRNTEIVGFHFGVGMSAASVEALENQ
jgi:hypothetical protein